jgi:hypothetical protein
MTGDPADRIEELEKRVRALEDEREIRELLSRYSFGADVYRGESWVSLWTDDGLYDLGPTVSYRGRDELMELITGPGMPPARHAQHHTEGPLIIRVDGDDAVVEGYSITYVKREDVNEVWNLGFSRWILRREGGRWRIAARHRREAGTDEQADVITDREATPLGPS